MTGLTPAVCQLTRPAQLRATPLGRDACHRTRVLRTGHRRSLPQHCRRLRLAGRQDTRLGRPSSSIAESRPPTACPACGGRSCSPSGVLGILDDMQLAAVLAHERAHQSGRHHLLVTLAGVPATAFPRVPAFRRARGRSVRAARRPWPASAADRRAQPARTTSGNRLARRLRTSHLSASAGDPLRSPASAHGGHGPAWRMHGRKHGHLGRG
jgi:hypothetical protein